MSTKKADKKATLKSPDADFARAVATLRLHTETHALLATAIRELLSATGDGDLWDEYISARSDIAKAQETVKRAARLDGPGRYDFGAFSVNVGSPPQSPVIDTDGLVERAEERGETEMLIAAGVLTYKVVPDQIRRLEGVQMAAYSSYVTLQDGTPSVTLPAALK